MLSGVKLILDCSNAINRITQNTFINSSELSDAARSAVCGLLNHVTRVAFGPFPRNLVRARGLVQSRPPIMIRFSLESPVHSFHDVARVREKMYAARLAQSFKSECGCGNLRLLVRGFAQKISCGAPQPAITQKRNASGARCLKPVAQA